MEMNCLCDSGREAGHGTLGSWGPWQQQDTPWGWCCRGKCWLDVAALSCADVRTARDT